MGQWSRTFFPILVVLKNDGRIPFKDLMVKLEQIDPMRLGNPKTIENAFDSLIGCLEFDGATVTYNRSADNYCSFVFFERSVQIALHKALDMETFELYPFLHRSNSETCYQGVPWSEIPVYENRPDDCCDFQRDSDGGFCYRGCGIDESVLEQHRPASYSDDLSDTILGW